MSQSRAGVEKESFQTLQKGQSGTMVYIVQKILNHIGYSVEENGLFSEKMESIVKTFQTTRDNLVVDGIVGYQTMKEMDEASNII